MTGWGHVAVMAGTGGQATFSWDNPSSQFHREVDCRLIMHMPAGESESSATVGSSCLDEISGLVAHGDDYDSSYLGTGDFHYTSASGIDRSSRPTTTPKHQALSWPGRHDQDVHGIHPH